MRSKELLFVLLLIVTSQINAQVDTLNLDSNDQAWLTGGCLPLPPEKEALIPELILTPESISTPLPVAVYNDERIYFPPIFSQDGQSCSQAAGIGYTFTYEMNRLRNVAAGNWVDKNNRENLYHPLYTYNFLNEGSGSTKTYITSGFEIVQDNGCPSYDVYDHPALYGPNKFRYWMSGALFD